MENNGIASISKRKKKVKILLHKGPDLPRGHGGRVLPHRKYVDGCAEQAKKRQGF